MVIMGDTKELPRNVDNGKPCTSTKPLRKSVMYHHAELTTGASGAAVTPSFNLNTTGNIEEDNCGAPRNTRRGRSAINLKASEHSNAKNPGSDTDGKHGSPSDPATYLNSVRNNLNFDFSSSPINERHSTGISNHGNNGSATGHKPPQKKKNRLQESGGHHKPAEVFRKDLISAMKIPDTSHLSSEEYWVMRDTWRMEWEKGVQVPVNPGALPAVKIEVVLKDARRDFRMPKKHIKTMPDAGDRDTVNLNVLADKTCRYDLDEVDVAWLKVINEERLWQGYERLDEFTMEIIMEELESQCHESMQLAIKTKEGLGIEYDENIVCDVCRTPDSEDGNEMVFCDGCNLCVHQACYGIVKVPAGSWLCKPCALGIRGSAVCILCGRKGGAMKSTKSGRKWAHMSCALWIPEVNIADPARMEPITKISHIPASRWSLLCTVCKERSIGACIQCTVKHCVTAYHVTCAMENGFEMKTDCCSPTTAPTAGESSVVFRSYCQKHSKIPKKRLENSPGKKSEEERRSDRQKRIAELEEQFFTLVRGEAVSTSLNIPLETTTQVMEYWKLKRKANFNRFLVTPKQEEGKALEEAAETGLQRRLKMFTHLRQDLERVRNLCYMIGRREKLKKVVVSQMREIFLEQSHYFESLMMQNKGFNPRTFLSSLTKFGSEELVKMAKEESKELAKTDEWSPETSSDEVVEPPVPDDIEDVSETIRLSRAQDIVKETPLERISVPLPETKRKNGLVKNHKRAKYLAKLDKSRHSRSESKNDRAKNHRQQTPSLSQNPESSDRTSCRNFVTSSDTVHESSPKHKGQRVKHRSESDNTPEADTVKDSRSSKKLRRKRPSHEQVERSSREETSGDAEAHAVSHKETGTPSHAQKKMRVGADVEVANKRDKTSSSVKRNDKAHREKPRRSPRHTTDSSDLEDFDVPKHSPKKRKMTISTETISETERIDKRKARSTTVKTLDSPSTAGVKKARSKGDNEHSEGERNEKTVKALKQQSSSGGHENKAPSSRSTRSGSKTSESDAPTSRCLRSHSSSDESSQSARNETTANATKNEERALAPSSEIDNTGAECDKKEDIDAKRRSRSSPSPVQELEEQKRLKSDNSSEYSPQKALPSSTLFKKAPIISLEKPNMAYVAAGLNISYGSSAPLPLRQNSQHKSPTKTRSSGLKWVSIGEDSEMSQRLKTSSQKSQDGYHGDVDESPLNSHRGDHKQTLTRKQSSTNPGKYRTGIGVFSPKCSDSSDDDFDIPIPSSSEKTLSRQKLRSISNDIRYDSSDKHSITQTLGEQNNSVEFTKRQSGVKANEPKNVRAVGGILDAQKSEPSANAVSHESRTTGGDYSQDNFFEKFSLMAEKPINITQQPLGSISQASNLPFGPVSAKMLDFQQGALPFQSHSLFPYGTPINPWQVGPSTMPSIMPSQYKAFNSYPAHHIQNHGPQLYKHPSPPQLPDSTLSPESSTQNSASVAVQASTERSLTPIQSKLHNRDRTVQRETIQSRFEDNEWEIVRDDDTTYVEQCHLQRDDSTYKEHRHHRKHKKRKKKKKKRKRMLFPDDYESERRELSSPSGPIHGAIVPKGHSMQFGVSMQSSQESENTESGSEKPHKLVLKINKKDLLTQSPHNEPTTDLYEDKEAAGLKLTIKKSKYEHLMKKYKRHKHNHHSRLNVNDLANVTAQAAQNNVKVNVEKKSGLLRRLGITKDDLQNTDDDGIGRRALRERKSIITKKKQSEPGHQKSTKHDHSKEIVPKKHSKIAAVSKKGLKGDMKRADDQNVNAMIASGEIPKRVRGRPKKGVTANKRVSVKQEHQEGKEWEQPVMGDRKDLAKFAGWTTKSSNNANHKQPLSRSSSIKSMSSHFKPSSVGLRGRGSAVPIRSFSTDSDQNLTLSGINSQDSQPARHWKKRKVHEHETQASEQPDLVLPHNDKKIETSCSTAVNEQKSNSLEGLSKMRKLPKTRSLDVVSSGGRHEKNAQGHARGQKLNQIINSLGEKASIRAVESAKTGTKPDISKHFGKRVGAHPSTDSKNVFNSFIVEKQPSAELAAKGSESIGSHSLIKQRTKSESSNPTPTKTNRSDHHLDFALQTGPLNYKIPKKLHQTVNETVPDP